MLTLQVSRYCLFALRSSIKKYSTYIPSMRNLSLYHDVDHNIAGRFYPSSEDFRGQILTFKVGPCTVRVKMFIIAVDT